MCGIAGWYTWSDTRLTRDRITTLWRKNEFRGKDAAGVAYVRDRQLMYVKQQGKATELASAIDAAGWSAIAQSPLGLLHTRAKTQGSAAENKNNHPVVSNGWVVVHNGMIWNDDALFAHFNAERAAEVDTVAINLVLGRGPSVEESLAHACTLRGSASVAAVNASRPDEVVLFRLGGPAVHLYWLPAASMFVWSSDSDGGRAIEDITAGGFAGFSQVYMLPDNTALHLTPAGLKRYTLTPKPFGPSFKVRSGGERSGGSGLGSSSSFFPGGWQGTTRSTATGASATEAKGAGKKPPVIPQGQSSLAVLADNTGLLEEPLFQGSYQEYHYQSRYDYYIPSDGSFVLPTGYGRWIMTRAPNGDIVREFKPHRRVRRRWDQEFNDSGAAGGAVYTVTLPASPEQQDDLSDLLRLGRVDLVFSDGTNSDALICPWCGVMRHPEGWKSIQYECEWCHVKSLPPKEVMTCLT